MAEIMKGSNSTAAIDRVSTGATMQNVDGPQVNDRPAGDTIKNGENVDLKIATALQMGKVTNDLVDIEGGVKSNIILTEKDQANTDNIINEAVEKKMADGGTGRRFLKNFMMIRPIIATYYRTIAADAVKKAGDTKAAFERLGLESSSLIGTSSEEQAQRDARLILEKSGFADKVDSKNSVGLGVGDKIEKVEDATTENVNNALKDLFNKMESAYRAKDDKAIELARKEYDGQLEKWQSEGVFGDNQSNLGRKILENKVVMFLVGDHSKRSLTEIEGLKKAADGVEDLVKHKVSSEAFDKYLDAGNLSLYNASMKEGLNTKRKVNSVLAAVGAAGLVGGLTYYKMSTRARTGMKSTVGAEVAGQALGGAGLGAVTGAAAGAAFGAARGVGRAMEKMSKAEIADATSGEAIVTAEERAELAKAAAAEAAAKAANEAEGNSQKNSERDAEDVSITEQNGNAENKISKKARVMRAVSRWSRVLHGEERSKFAKEGAKTRLENINEKRGRANAKDLYDALERDTILLKLSKSENQEDFRNKLKEMKDRNDGSLEIFANNVSDFLKDIKGLDNGRRKRLINLANNISKGEFNKKDLSKLGEIMRTEDFRNVVESSLKNTIVDIRARENLVNKNGKRLKVDLIRYSEGNVDRERSLLREKMLEANEMLGENGVKADGDSAVEAKIDELKDLQKSIWRDQAAFTIQNALVGAASGAAMGGVFGALAGKLKDMLAENSENATAVENEYLGKEGAKQYNSSVDGDNIKGAEVSGGMETNTGAGEIMGNQPQLVDEDGDGIYELKVGSETVVTESDGGITFDPETGKMSEGSMELLRSHGFEINETAETSIAHGARTTEGIYDYFKNSNSEAYGESIETGNKIADIDIKSYITAEGANRAVNITPAGVENDGDLVFQVTTLPNSGEIDVDKLQVVLTPSKDLGNVGVVLDVAPDGTVTVPAGSVAASMFTEGNFSGGMMRVVQEASGEGGGYNVLSSTAGSGTLENIGFSNPVEKITYSYDLNGAAFNVPDESQVESALSRVGVESIRNSGPVEYTYQDIGNVPTDNIEGPVDFSPEFGRNYISINGAAENDNFELVGMPHREGNYSEMLDPFLSDNKEGNNLLGENLVRQMIDPDYEMSPEEADNAFIEALNSGRMSTAQAVYHILEAKGNSPEGIVSLRAKLGGFEWDIDGDGNPELIDTQEEINAVADMLKNSAEPEGYSAFVNDTYEHFFEKMNGGEVKIVNYAETPYRYTELGFLNNENNILRLFSTKKTACSGIGFEFLDKDGKSIYDEDIIRRIYGIPSNQRIGMISDRLECGDDTQTTVQTFFKQAAQKAVDNTETQAQTTTQGMPTTSTPLSSTPTPGQPTTPNPTTPTPGQPTPPNPTTPTPDQPVPVIPRPGKGGNTHAGDEYYMDDTAPVTAENRIVFNENPGSEMDRTPGSEIVGENANIATEGVVTDANGNALTDASGNVYITNGTEENVGANIVDKVQTTFNESTEGRVEGAPSDVAVAMGGNPDNAAAEAARKAAEEAAQAADVAAKATSGAGVQTEVSQGQAAQIYQDIISNPQNGVAQNNQ